MPISSLVARSLIRSALPKLFRAGYSANKAMEFMKAEIGVGYRRTLFLADWREISGVEKVKESFKYVPKKYRLSFGLTVPRATPMSTNYQYLFRTTGLMPDTGEITHQWVSMLDDVRMSPERAEELMQQILMDREKYPDPAISPEQLQVELFVAYRTREIIYERR